MSIQKKSLIGNMTAAKKAIVATNSGSATNVPSSLASRTLATKNLATKNLATKNLATKSFS
jgi:hypothetical protein